jgi:hypothetical protein
MRGPIDYIIVEFPKNNFKGEILDSLDHAVQDGTIAVLDLALISKDADGNISGVEAKNSDFGEHIRAGEPSGIISTEDVSEMGEMLHNNSSAGLLVIEHLWAKGLAGAISNAGGVLVAEGRIHPEAYAEINGTKEV